MSTYIRDWEELTKIPNESKTHILEVDLKRGNAMLYAKDKSGYKSKLSMMRNAPYMDFYLSTHTFYGKTYKRSTKILRACGFDVEIANWDDPSFNKPIQIHNWEELAKIPNESKTHILKISLDEYRGWLIAKNRKDYDLNIEFEDQYLYLNHYLSTHAFYKNNYKHTTKVLQKCGFNVEIIPG